MILLKAYNTNYMKPHQIPDLMKWEKRRLKHKKVKLKRKDERKLEEYK